MAVPWQPPTTDKVVAVLIIGSSPVHRTFRGMVDFERHLHMTYGEGVPIESIRAHGGSAAYTT